MVVVNSDQQHSLIYSRLRFYIANKTRSSMNSPEITQWVYCVINKIMVVLRVELFLPNLLLAGIVLRSSTLLNKLVLYTTIRIERKNRGKSSFYRCRLFYKFSCFCFLLSPNATVYSSRIIHWSRYIYLTCPKSSVVND